MTPDVSALQKPYAISRATSTPAPRNTLLFLLLATCLAVFVYFYGLGSDHIATNGDELLYAQIARATALSGHWLPLQSPIAHHTNTKPPLLFWQGMVSTHFAKEWSLFNLRYPNVLYTLATALMLVLLGKRLSETLETGLLAALLFLSFFGTFRYGRCFLTSAPEVFWLFAPFFLLLQWPRLFSSWAIVPFFGIIIGIGLLYKSFALLVPVAAGLSWWYLRACHYDYKAWLSHDLGKIVLLSFIALGIFGLWFLGDPHPQAIFHDFIVRENAGKFDAGGLGNYLFQFFFGGSSIWRNVVAYPLNAGLLMPAVIFLLLNELFSFFKISIPTHRFSSFFQKKATSSHPDEGYLWSWLATVFIVFSFPNQRDERYLLLAMPALALLLALHWKAIPRWMIALTLVAVAVVTAGLAALSLLLEHHLASPAWNFYHYPGFYWLLLGSVLGFALFGIRAPQWTRLFACPGVLLVYVCYGAFLAPFDGPLGHFDAAAQAAIDHQEVLVPINFNAREESYRFLLPGSLEVIPYDYKPTITIAEMQAKAPYFIVSLPLTDHSEELAQGAELLGRRLNLIDRFNAKETQAILLGNIAPYLFHQDLLFKKK